MQGFCFFCVLISVVHTYNTAYEWSIADRLSVKGLVLLNGNVHNAGMLVSELSAVNSFHETADYLRRTDGFFAFVKQVDDDTVWLATDKSHLLPLFYAFTDKCYVSDSAHLIAELIDAKADAFAVDCFRASGFSPFNRTLFDGVYSAPNGFLIELKNGAVSQNICIGSYNSKNKSFGHETFYDCSKSVFDDVGSLLDGKIAMVALSGGYDSRYVLSGLVMAGYPKIICFSYGGGNSKEIELASKVCQQLGLQHIVIEYNENNLYDLTDSVAFKEYIQYSANASALPHVHEYFACERLQKMGYTPENSVILSGLSDRVLGPDVGYKISKSAKLRKHITEYILHTYHYSKLSKHSKELLVSDLGKRYLQYERPFWKASLQIVLDEVMNKTVNTVSLCWVYQGFQVITPLLSEKIIAFFNRLDFEELSCKTFFRAECERWYFEPLRLLFENEFEMKICAFKWQALKQKAKNYMPAPLLPHKNFKLDVNNTKIYAMPFIEKLEAWGIKKTYKDDNAVFIEWYLHLLDKGI